MDSLYENIIRPVFFTQDPETMHELALKAMTIVGAVPPLRSAMEYLNLVKTPNPVKVFGLEFPNRVGLAAGFDKDAYAWRGAAAFGFGHVEIGTVSMLKQAGNPRPRQSSTVADSPTTGRSKSPRAWQRFWTDTATSRKNARLA